MIERENLLLTAIRLKKYVIKLLIVMLMHYNLFLNAISLKNIVIFRAVEE